MTDKLTETETYWQTPMGQLPMSSIWNRSGIRMKKETGKILSTTLCRWIKVRTVKIRLRRRHMITARNPPRTGYCSKDSMLMKTPSRCKNGDRVVYIRPVRTLPLPTATGSNVGVSLTPDATPSVQPTETPQPALDQAPQETPQPTDELLEDEAEDAVSQRDPAQCAANSQCLLAGRTRGKQAYFPLERGRTRNNRNKGQETMYRRAEYDPYVYNPELEYQAVEYSNVFGNGWALPAPKQQRIKRGHCAAKPSIGGPVFL